MKRYKGFTASPGLVLGQVSRLERPPLVFGEGPFHPEQEKQALEDAIQLAQKELNDMADRAAPTEQAIFLFQSMMLEDEGFMNEVNFQIRAGVGAAEAMDRVGRRYAAQLSAMKDNAYMQLRSVDILDVTQRITNILCRRPRSWLALDHPVIIASDLLMPTDLFSIPQGRILGLITAEGSGQSHAAIIARSLNIPGITQVGRDFLEDCDGREVILNATEGECILDPDAAARQRAITRICELQRQNEELNAQLELPNRTRDGEEFELLANCFGPEDVGTAMSSGASGVGLLRSSYMMLPGHAMDEQEQYLFYTSCLAAAKGKMVTVRTFDFGADRTMADAYQGVQSSKLGLRGIRSSLRNLPQMAVQICALMRAAAKGPLRVMFPMVTDIEDWDSAMQVVDHCRRKLAERGEEFEPDVPFGVMLSIPAALSDGRGFYGPRLPLFCHRHQRPDPVHPRREPGAGHCRALLPPRQPGYEKAHRHGGGRREKGRHPCDDLRPCRRQRRQRHPVSPPRPAQLLHESPEPSGHQKGPAGCRNKIKKRASCRGGTPFLLHIIRDFPSGS